MLFLILSCLLGGVAGLVLILAAKVYHSKKNLEFYRKQGMVTIYSARSGPSYLFLKSHPENKKHSNLELMKKLVNEPDSRKAGAFVLNKMIDSGSVINIHSSDLVKEFLLNEDSFEKPPPLRGLTNFMGLFFENGPQAFHSKSLFTKIFNYEGMDAFVPKICTMINRQFDKFIAEKKISKTATTRISLDEIYKPIMGGIANLIVFGDENMEASDGLEELPKMLNEIFNCLMNFGSNIFLMFLPFGLVKKLGLIPQFRVISETFKKQQQILARYIQKRESADQLGDYIIDRIILHNRKCREEGNTKDLMSIEQIAGNYNIFHFAGTDTSQNVSKMAICHMADLQYLKDHIDAVNRDIYDSKGSTEGQKLEASEGLTLWAKECLRIHCPLSETAIKRAVKDVKIGNYSIKKRDQLMITITGLHFDKDHFKNPDYFDLERFKKERVDSTPRYQYIPFSAGKRVCLGRHLGELMVKLLVTQFCRRFDFSRPADVEYYVSVLVNNVVENPFVDVKLKE